MAVTMAWKIGYSYTQLVTNRYIVVVYMLKNRVLFRRAFERLERYAMKVARTVLRGGSGSNATSLPDHADHEHGVHLPDKIVVVEGVAPAQFLVFARGR